jgi:hypothetical protein
MRTAAELFPHWPAERRARWTRARAYAGDVPRVRVGCGCQCDERGVFAPRTLREASPLSTPCTMVETPAGAQ